MSEYTSPLAATSATVVPTILPHMMMTYAWNWLAFLAHSAPSRSSLAPSPLLTYRMALYQVISAMFFSVVAMSSFQRFADNQDQHDSQQLVLNATCIAAGFLLQYSSWIKLLITTATTLHLFLLMVFNWNLQKKYGTKLEVAWDTLASL